MSNVEQALERHMVDMRRYAISLMRNRNDADELVQDCAVRALSKPGSWENVRDPRAYLFAILHNLFVDTISNRRREGIAVDPGDVEFLLCQPPTQLDHLELRDTTRCLRNLPDKQREILLLIGVDGLSYRDAALATGVPCGTVMSRLSRARSSLRMMVDGLPMRNSASLA